MKLKILPARRLKIALVCDWYLPRIGGIEMQLKELAPRLALKGHIVHVITPLLDPGVPPFFEKVSKNVKVIRIKTLLLPGFKVMVSPEGVNDLEVILTQEKYDVVHSHFSYISPFAMAGLYAARKCDIPGIITFHSFLRGFGRVLGILDRLTGWTGWPSAYTAVSPSVAEDVQGLCRKNRVSLLGNGIDPKIWFPREKMKKGENIRLVSIMRLSRKKRGPALIRIFHDLKRRLKPGMNLELTIIGDGSDYGKMARMIRKRRLDGQIRLMGFQTHEVIRRVFSSSDIFVLPSILESFGIAALEARCSGLPVVAMTFGGVKTFIRDNIEGFLAEDDTHMALCLARLIQIPDLLDRITRHNTHTPCPFTWDRVIEDHLQLYLGLSCPPIS